MVDADYFMQKAKKMMTITRMRMAVCHAEAVASCDAAEVVRCHTEAAARCQGETKDGCESQGGQV